MSRLSRLLLRVTLSSVVLSVPSAPALAQTVPPPAPAPAPSPKPLTLEIEAGAVLTDGNTRTRTGKGNVSARYETGRWRQSAMVEALYAEDRERTTAQRLAAAAKSDYKVAEFDYLFLTGRYESERFTGFDYRVSEAAGYGRRVLHTRRVTLDLEAGPGGRHTRSEDGRHEDELIGRAAARLAWNLSTTAAFTEAVRFEAGENGTDTESETALRSQVIGNVAMKLSFTIRHRSEVPAGTRRTDTVTAVTLVYTF